MKRAVVVPEEPTETDEPLRPRSVIRAELRQLAEVHLSQETLAWAKKHFPNIWPAPMEQTNLF